MPAGLTQGPLAGTGLLMRGEGLTRGPNRRNKLKQAVWSGTWPAVGATLDLDFLNNRGVVRGFGQGGALDQVAFTRASAGTRFNPSGQIELVASGVPRFDFDPVTLLPLGLLLEQARTNLLLNATIDGANLATQNVTVTAQSYTVSFYGTGSIALSGAYTATVTGTGSFPTRKTLTFTPTAGTLTCTVSGTVQYAQLEAGAFATSFIPTAASQATRAIESATITGADLLNNWLNNGRGTFFAEVTTDQTIAAFNSAYKVMWNSGASIAHFVYISGSWGLNDGSGAYGGPAAAVSATPYRLASTYKGGNSALVANGGTIYERQTSSNWPSDKLFIGDSLNGHHRRLVYFPQWSSQAQLRALST